MREIVIDTETTGLDPLAGHRIAVPIPSGGMVAILFAVVSLLSFRFRSCHWSSSLSRCDIR